MFLMNAPPVLPLQSAWEACGPPGSCWFPGRLSEPEGAAGAAVSARVQMIISSLRGDRAARGRSQERALHRGHRGRHAQPAAAPACGLAAHSDPKRKEAASAPGAPGRDSDSDDSVDRGIEEAIQEYLKAKSGAADRDPRCHPEPPPNSAPTAPCPPKRAPGSGGIPGGRVGAGQAPGSASPGSVSSEDSFEQGIRAEIERFLREKRRHEAPQGERPADRKPSPGAHLATPALRPGKEPAGAGKELVFQNPPRLATAAAPPRSLRSKVAAEPESAGGPKPAPPRPAAACRTADAPGKGRVRRSLGPGRRGQGVRSTGPDPVRAAADSSSDDGIEEAIQRYQREKRKEASGDLPQKTPPGEPPPVPPAHGASHAPKSALPDTPRRALGKKKPVASKAADLGPGGLDPDHPSKPPREPKAPAAPGSTAARSRFADGASCRADSAELMCAEAILDISKTILPAPGEGGAGPPPASPLPGPRRGPSRSDGDSSSVDSDDSIEQEIRNFLALKAQSGTLLARADTCPPSTQSPPLPPGPPGQAGDAKAPIPKAPEPPLSCRRKRRAGGGAVRSLTPKKTREAVKEGAPDTGPGEAPGRDGEARGQCPPCRTAGLGDEHGAGDARGGVAPGPGKAAEAPRADGKESSEDESSSLDSDEDLDTAIKDLLRSKRRLRRRWRDPRAGGRKKVRFGSTRARALGPQGGPQRGGRDQSPAVLRSCLCKSKRDGWAGPPGRRFRGPTESARPGGAGPADPPQALPSGPSPFPSEAEARHRPGSAASPGLRSDDSSSVDSDDSIELEIRKFLAEKAKETESGSETPGAAPGSGPRPEPLCRKGAAPAPQPGMCTRSQRGRGTPQPAAGLRGTPRTEPACLPAAPPRGQPGAPRSSSGTASARGSPAGKRSLHPHRDQSPRGASSVAEADARARSPGGALPVASQSRSAPTRSPGADREGGPQAGLALPWGEFAPQSPLQGTWALSSEGRDVAWKGALGSEREGAPEGPPRGAAGLATDPRKGLPFAGFSPLLPTQLFHFGSSATWGAPGPGLFSPGLSLPLQGPAFSAFREAPAGHAGRFGRSRLLGKEARPWPRRRALGSRGGRNSGSDEDVLDLRYRRRADRDEDREAWRSDTSELSDTSVEDGSPVAKGKVLQL